MDSLRLRSRRIRSSVNFVCLVVSAAVFTDVFLYSIIVPVLPFVLHQRSKAPPEQVPKWISLMLGIFGVANMIGCVIMGRVADKARSRRLPFMSGLVALGAATVLFWVTKSPVVMVVARFLQGISASAVWVVGLAILVDNCNPESLGVSMAWTNMASTVGELTGPPAGGFLYRAAGYHSIFVVALGLLGIDIGLRSAMIDQSGRENPDTSPEAPEAERLLGQADASSASGTVQKDVNTNEGQEPNGQPSVKPSGTGDHAKVKDAEATISKSLRDDDFFVLLRSRRLLVALSLFLLTSTLISSFDAILPQFVIATFDFDSAASGMSFLPMTIDALFAPLIGRFVDVVGTKWSTALGVIVSAVALLLLRLVSSNTQAQLILLYILLFFVGMGMGIKDTAGLVEVSQCVEEIAAQRGDKDNGASLTAQAYGIVGLAAGAGQLLGPTVIGTLMDKSGWPTATLVMGLADVIIIPAVVMLTGGPLPASLAYWRAKRAPSVASPSDSP